MTDLAAVYRGIDRYYSRRIRRFGPVPLGVDWHCQATQELRFVQLLRACDFGAPFSLNDLGCGYGALRAFQVARHPDAQVDYLGIDLSARMVDAARARWAHDAGARFVHARVPTRRADHSVASGIFNVRLRVAPDDWERFVGKTLDDLAEHSMRGFSVNFIALRPGESDDGGPLYRTHPERWADHCVARFGADVRLVAGYGLREFTLLVALR